MLLLLLLLIILLFMPKFIRRLSSGNIFVLHSHIGLAAIEYTYIIGEPRSKYLEPEFPIAIRGPNGDKWQLKTLFLSVFRAFSIATYPVCLW